MNSSNFSDIKKYKYLVAVPDNVKRCYKTEHEKEQITEAINRTFCSLNGTAP